VLAGRVRVWQFPGSGGAVPRPVRRRPIATGRMMLAVTGCCMVHPVSWWLGWVSEMPAGGGQRTGWSVPCAFPDHVGRCHRLRTRGGRGPAAANRGLGPLGDL